MREDNKAAAAAFAAEVTGLAVQAVAFPHEQLPSYLESAPALRRALARSPPLLLPTCLRCPLMLLALAVTDMNFFPFCCPFLLSAMLHGQPKISLHR